MISRRAESSGALIHVLQMMPGKRVFISGGTGYLGRALVADLLASRHAVTLIVRRGSEGKAPDGCRIVSGDAFDKEVLTEAARGCDVYVHLLGEPKPAPWKGERFRAVDQRSLEASVEAARAAGVPHFIYVSVAHPAPVMRSYIAVRAACEETIRRAGLTATILRPWYVIGPGHWWPLALMPLYKLAERVPFTRAGALRLGLVTHRQMTLALAAAVESVPSGIRIADVPLIRSAGAEWSRGFSRAASH